MSAIQARIRAFETLQDAPKPLSGPRPPINLYEAPPDDQNDPYKQTDGAASSPSRLDQHPTAHDDDSEAHNLVVGSITSDFVKISPPRKQAPPLPPRKTTGDTTSSGVSPSPPSTSRSTSGEGSDAGFSRIKSPPTPKAIPPKNKVLLPVLNTNGGGGGDRPNGGGGGGLSINIHPRNGKGHNHAVSSSSFHSVSLSDNEQAERHHTGETHDEPELGGSYEAVSPHASSVFSLLERPGASMNSSPALSASSLAPPPALPPRPSSGGAWSGSESSHVNVPYAVRKVPPPPPSGALHSRLAHARGHQPTVLEDVPHRSSARSSLASIASISTATGTASPSQSSVFSVNTKHTSRTSTQSWTNLNVSKKRPPPLPPTARGRYDAVFDANFRNQEETKKKRRAGGGSKSNSSSSRRAVGWRGTSVDLTTTGGKVVDSNPEKEENDGEEARLHGRIVKRIWQCSKLPSGTLKTIWRECDAQKTGSLDKQSFAQGMWRIDNELLAAASLRSKPSTPRSSMTRRA